ncbi:hypothetical protein SPBR_03942 [Sporothrix brasiliensis 5110]|uniref:Uncharacterized protein n=1 Tax=Sporothrix brasiliensis 5110 TaxID=1398154 RepID=A0A0C2JE77_9PEZI|nr:uncharacterized protein SPBR_03942 [Sporothrix brasiliensis 5110]KIH95257.1 hypothetical protein SPBR_03942 [Sporothrix brasiliensis 5110]
MAIPWGTLKSLLLFFGPMLLPRVLGMYRKLKAEAGVRAQQSQQGGAAAAVVRPLAFRSVLVLSLLAAAALAWLLSGGLVLPASASHALRLPSALRMPENVFAATESRLQAPTDVLFTRLASNRPNHTLTAADEALRLRLVSLESRLLYLQYGPDALVNCPFCGGTGVDAASRFSAMHYLYYAMADLVAAHLANLVLIALVTSPLLLLGRRGKSSGHGASAGAGAGAASVYADFDAHGESAADHAYDVAATHIRRWRTPASLVALCFAALDLYLVASYNGQRNARATRLAELDFFYWSMRTYRAVACGGLLAALAAVLYLAASGRHSSPRLGLLGVVLFGALPPPSPAHRVTAVTRGLAGVKSKLSAGAIVKNTALRDTDLRARTQAYWAREVMLVAEAMEERDVIEGVNDALQNRIDIQRIARDAEQYAQNVIPSSAPSSSAGRSSSHGSSQTTPVQPQPQVVVSRSTTPVAAGNKPTKRK